MTQNPETTPDRGRILVVDDTPATLIALCELLVEEHEVLFASSGTEALEMALAQPPDLILLDVLMPGMDGYEVCAGLKADSRTADIPVIFITSKGEEPDQARGLAVGAIDYVQKPISPPLVRARVRNHLDLKRKQDRIRGLMILDGLTGIPNRRHFDEILREEWMRGVRNQKPLSLIMIDLDHFKRYNDAYGHAAGDACLQQVAGALRKALQRPVDLVARYGGEEFVCLLPETDAPGALKLAARIKEEVAALALPHRDSPTTSRVTLSQGVATALPVAEGQPESLLLAADTALYDAKRGGRDRIAQSGAGKRPASMLSQGGRGDPNLPTILLVEDDKHMRALLAARIDFLPANVELASSAQEALTYLARDKAHLILSDVVMPGMDGFALCQRLKEDPARRHIPFVLLTSLSRELRERSAQAGADDHLSKQEDDSVFRMRIRYLLELGVRSGGEAAVADAAAGTLVLLSASATIRTQLTMHLHPTGIRVRPTGALEEVLSDLQGGLPDLLGLDLDPGGGDPADSLRRLRNVPGAQRVPCFVLAQKEDDGLLASLEEQVQDRLPKPLDAQDVRHRTRLLLRFARAHQQAE